MSVLKFKENGVWKELPALTGLTPVKGVDYYTQEEKEAIIEEVVDTISENGGGLPTGSEPHQMLVTDKDGKAGWEDKLCWMEQETVTVLPETVMVFSDDMFVGTNPLEQEIIIGDTYTVTYNGVDYQCEALVADTYAFGNVGAIAEGFPVTDDPFVLLVVPPEMAGHMGGAHSMCMPLDGAETVEVSIQTNVEQVKKIDAKYAPGYVFGEFPYKDRVFLKERTISGQNVQIPFDAPLVPDQIYTVTHNGTAYTVAPEDSSALSNGFKLEMAEESGDIIFSLNVPYDNLGMGLFVSNKSSTFTLSIVGSGVETVKIPDKLLEKPPFIITVAYSSINEIDSISATYEEINRAYRAGRSIFCLLESSSVAINDYFIPLTGRDGRGFVFQSTPWDAYEYYRLIIGTDGNTLEEITPALGALNITSAGGLTLKSSNGTEFKLTVSDDGTLTATQV